MHRFTLVIFLVPLISGLPQSTQIPSYTKLSETQVKHLQSKGFGPTVPTAFRPTVNLREEDDDGLEEDEDEEVKVASTQVRAPVYSEENYPVPNAIQINQQKPQPVPRKPVAQQYRPQYIQQQGEIDQKKKLEEEEEEKEEPDRLSILLPQTRFGCQGKNTGYYADEELGCEVFHYCQDNARHSWICPEGFTFHQVHLICMPPGGDNICEKSSQFHFVNEYLYKPLNLEEHQTKPNVSLIYSDRYYPDNYYGSYEEENEVPPQRHQKQPIQVGLQQTEQQRHQPVIVRRPTTYTPTLRPETTVAQVFRSPEEINISLQQRRPQYVNQRYQMEY